MALTVTNHRPWPVWGLLVEEDFLEPDKEDTRPAAMALALVTGWSKTQFEGSFTPPHSRRSRRKNSFASRFFSQASGRDDEPNRL
jgi:hypothetical protein